MGKYRQKNVWLFVHSMSVARPPSFGNTLLTRLLHIILHKKQRGRIFDIAEIVLFLITFMFISSFQLLNNCANNLGQGEYFSLYFPSI